MTLKDYLLNSFIEEKEVIEELLRIDNAICHTNLTYDELVAKISRDDNTYPQIEENINVLIDGDPDLVYQALIHYPLLIGKIHVNRTFVAVNKWFVERTKEFFLNDNIKLPLSLDIDKNYAQYDTDTKKIVVIGYDTFIEGMKELFDKRNIIAIEK